MQGSFLRQRRFSANTCTIGPVLGSKKQIPAKNHRPRSSVEQSDSMWKLVVVPSVSPLVATLCMAQTVSPAVRAFVKVDALATGLTHVRVIDGSARRSDDPAEPRKD